MDGLFKNSLRRIKTLDVLEFKKIDDKIAIITLNRPEKLNAINNIMVKQLKDSLMRFQNDIDLRVAIITGAGRAFCSGMDLNQAMQQQTTNDTDNTSIPEIIRTVTKPFIAAINGLVLGAGLWQIIMQCDIRIAAKSAVFGMPEINLAIPAIPQHFLIENIPLCMAMELVLTGEPISAKRAYEIGLINKVVPDTKLQITAISIANRIASLPKEAVQLVRKAAIEAAKESEEKWKLKKQIHVYPNVTADDNYERAVISFIENRNRD